MQHARWYICSARDRYLEALCVDIEAPPGALPVSIVPQRDEDRLDSLHVDSALVQLSLRLLPLANPCCYSRHPEAALCMQTAGANPCCSRSGSSRHQSTCRAAQPRLHALHEAGTTLRRAPLCSFRRRHVTGAIGR